MMGADAVKLVMEELKIDENDQPWPQDPAQGMCRILDSAQEALETAVGIDLGEQQTAAIRQPAARIGARVLRLLMALPD